MDEQAAGAGRNASTGDDDERGSGRRTGSLFGARHPDGGAANWGWRSCRRAIWHEYAQVLLSSNEFELVN